MEKHWTELMEKTPDGIHGGTLEGFHVGTPDRVHGGIAESFRARFSR